MTTIASGTSLAFDCTVRGQTFTVSTNSGQYATISGGPTTHTHGPSGMRRTYGPFELGDTRTITAGIGDISIEFGNATASQPAQQSNSLTAAVLCAGLGDSITQYWNHFVTPTAAVRAGNVVSITAAAHGLSQGAKVDIYGFRANTDFNARNVTINRIDANTFTYASIGSDVTATIDSTYARVSFQGWYSNVSAFAYANSRLKGALQLVDNFGQSSEQSTDILARLAPVLASSANWIICLWGANDVAGTSGASAMTAAASIANDASICAAILASGKNVMLRTIQPLGTGHAAFATATPKIVQINAARRALAAASNGRIRLCDSYAAIVNPATGGAKANTLQSDNVHPQTYGARLDGIELAAAFSGTPNGRFHTTSIADARATYSTSPNIWPVGQFSQTDAGSKSGPTNAASPPGGSVAGTLAGYNVTCTSGAGEVWMVPDDDGYGFGQVCSWTPSGAATVTIQQQSAGTMAALVAPGEVYRVGFHLKVAGVTSALTFLRCRIQGVFDGTTQVIGTPMHSDVGAASNVFTDFDEYIVGPEMVIPPFASCTSLTLEVIANFSGATTIHTITVSRMTFNKIR
jgi:lysophospholipase L1-like esterase